MLSGRGVCFIDEWHTETAEIDGLVSSWSKNISVSFCLQAPGRTDSVMCPQSSSRWRNTCASVTVTVCFFITWQLHFGRITLSLVQTVWKRVIINVFKKFFVCARMDSMTEILASLTLPSFYTQLHSARARFCTPECNVSQWDCVMLS